MSSPKPPTKAMLAAIGRVAAECAAVEDDLRELLCLLMDSPYARVSAAGEDLSNVALMCRRVARYNTALTDKDVETLDAICKAIDELRLKRNFLVHARWEKLRPPGEHVGMRSRRVSTRGEGSDIEGLEVWTPDVAAEVAEGFITVQNFIDVFIERTFGGRMNALVMDRSTHKRVNEWFARLERATPAD